MIVVNMAGSTFAAILQNKKHLTAIKKDMENAIELAKEFGVEVSRFLIDVNNF